MKFKAITSPYKSEISGYLWLSKQDPIGQTLEDGLGPLHVCT